MALKVDVTAIGEDIVMRPKAGGGVAATKPGAGARGKAGGGKPTPKDGALERQEKQLAQEAVVCFETLQG